MGAGGNIGAVNAAKAAPDGYTLFMVGINNVINPSLYQTLTYDPFKDFAPIGQAVSLQNILITHPTLAARTTRDFIAYAKSNPGKINYASTGIGSGVHLAGELFNSMAGVKMAQVPYKGGAPAASAVLAGGNIFAVSRRNGTFVFAAQPEFKLLAQNSLAGDGTQFNATPAPSGRQLFLRSDKFLYCLAANPP